MEETAEASVLVGVGGGGGEGSQGKVQGAAGAGDKAIRISWGSGAASLRKGHFRRALRDCRIGNHIRGRPIESTALSGTLAGKWVRRVSSEPGGLSVDLVHPLSNCLIGA